MFQKTGKKILIILIIVLITVLSASFFIFKYLKEIKTTVQDSSGAANIEAEEQLDEDSELLLGPQPGLSICQDKCGDGICQISDPECKDNMNCACQETKKECPQDCN